MTLGIKHKVLLFSSQMWYLTVFLQAKLDPAPELADPFLP